LQPFLRVCWNQGTKTDPLTRTIHGLATTRSQGDYVTLAMKPIYRHAVLVKGNLSAPGQRAEFVQNEVSKRNGVWIEVHDAIDKAFDQVFEKAENAIVAKFEQVFDVLQLFYPSLSEDSKVKSEKEEMLEGELQVTLEKNLVRVKEMLGEDGEITRLVADCKAYQSYPAANHSSMFVPQDWFWRTWFWQVLDASDGRRLDFIQCVHVPHTVRVRIPLSQIKPLYYSRMIRKCKDQILEA
jgi:hypothetical protein